MALGDGAAGVRLRLADATRGAAVVWSRMVHRTDVCFLAAGHPGFGTAVPASTRHKTGEAQRRNGRERRETPRESQHAHRMPEDRDPVKPSPYTRARRALLETRAGYRDGDGSFRGLNEQGDTLVHLFSTPAHACQPTIPDDVTVIARRAPVSLFGAGLVEAIEDDTLLQLQDPEDRNRDGVSGRAAMVIDRATGERRVGRFGWKAQHATLLVFGADAYLNEMGITNDLFPRDAAHGVSDAQMALCDPLPDPEDRRDRATGRRGIDNFDSFMKFLAPVPRSHIDDVTRDGERVFGAIGCASCHVPMLTTGPHASPVLHRKRVPLFSDLLLHDIGTGDGIRQADAEPDEIRTPSLWGVRFRRPLMHNGSAATLADAIAQHRGEADLARQGYERLSASELQRLLAFLKSL